MKRTSLIQSGKALIGQAVFIRYLAVSGLALVVDMGSFLEMLNLGVDPTFASAVSYSLGIVAHWLLSSRTVFTDGVAQRGPERTRQKVLFVLSALVGLAVTAGIVAMGQLLGENPRLSKLAAIVVSFLVTWSLRRNVVFAVRH